MDLKGKRFLLLGGAGLIGSHTVDQLIKEATSCLSIVIPRMQKGGVDRFEIVIETPNNSPDSA